MADDARESAAQADVGAQAAAAGTVPGTVSDGPSSVVEPEEPDVLSARGAVVVKLADWSLTAFQTTLGEGEDAVTVVVTRTGLRVTKAQAKEIQAAARSHGVELTEEAAE